MTTPRPSNRFFIGPLTPSQCRRRQRNRDRYHRAAEIADARYIPFRDALLAADRIRKNPFAPIYAP